MKEKLYLPQSNSNIEIEIQTEGVSVVVLSVHLSIFLLPFFPI